MKARHEPREGACGGAGLGAWIVEASGSCYKGLLFLATTHTYRHVRQGAHLILG